MDSKRGKLFGIKKSRRCKFMPNMQQNTLAAGLCSDPLGEIMRSPEPLSAMKGTAYKGRKKRRGGLL